MNTSKYLPFGLGAVVIIVIGFIAYGRSQGPSTPITQQTPAVNTQNEQTPDQKIYSLIEVGQHNKPDDCWAIIEGSVYNLTNWINQHPGGREAILGLCGKDGTSAFAGQHGGDARPEQMLSSMKIGNLNK